ncbi:MAG: flagellar biosynthesis protein FlhB [Rhodospirillales bacterium]
MAEEDDAQKTEEPSQRKLSRARQQGQVASSQEIKHWGILIAATIAIATLVPGAAFEVLSLNKQIIAKSYDVPVDLFNLRDLFSDILLELLWILAPFLGVMILAAIATSIIQSGLVWAPSKIQPKFSNISVIKGFGRLISLKSVIELVKGAFKLIVIATIAVLMVLPFLDEIGLVPYAHITETVEQLHDLILIVLVASVIVMTIVAFIDYTYQRYAFVKQMRMTKQEVKDEHKQAEGDPQVKARIRQLRAERTRQRMMAAVPEADVVVTNPTHFAVALRYKMEEMSAPVVVAKGQDFIALKIREIAEENDVPIYESPPLARTLYAAVEIDQEIPTEHYQAVAEVIGFVMRLKGMGGNQAGAPGGGPGIS